MRPGARIGAVIEILEELSSNAGSADRIVSAYTRSRRYIGSKDRRAIGDLTYAVLRARLRLIWWQERAGCAEDTARTQILAFLVLSQNQSPSEIAALFGGEGYGPAKLTPEEEALLVALADAALDHPEQPDWVRDEVPAWLHEGLQARFGGDMAAEMSALRQEAEVVLRVNGLKSERSSAQTVLADEGVETRPTEFSPLGLRVEGRRALQATKAFREGLVEVQDEGSQLIALLCDVRPDMAVADTCAGAGGKTLALADLMKNRGRLVALDVDGARLRRAVPRLERAGAGMVELQSMPDANWMADNAAAFDRVLVDAPCSGCGVWRRQPDARLTLTPDRLAGYEQAQAEALQTAAGLVKFSGRLIYATCSLLPEEDEGQVEAFLENNRDFEQLSMADVWAGVLPEVDCPADGPHLLLTPRRHGTDGFFVSVLERIAAA